MASTSACVISPMRAWMVIDFIIPLEILLEFAAMRYNEVEQARNYLLDRIGATPDIAVIMGSGLSAVDEILRETTRIHYVSIPHFQIPKVAGHRAEAVFGKAGGLNVLVFEGRVHY